MILIVSLILLDTITILFVLAGLWVGSYLSSRTADSVPLIPVAGRQGTGTPSAVPTQTITAAPTRNAAEETPTVAAPVLPASPTAAPSAAPVNPTPTATAPQASPTAAPSATAPQPTPIAWEGSERVTILIMGIDYRDWSAGADIPRTDSMILLTVDPQRKTAGMLSIPRDLWVHIPGMGEHKINTAYRWGELYKMEGGGPSLAMRTVEEVIGVPVQYYILLDFNTFVKFIDEMGGLQMHIREEMKIDPVGPDNTVTLQPGEQKLSGALALAYARSRVGAFDDFDRSQRQQEVILAIRDQVLSLNMLPGLIARAPDLYDEIAAGLRTNLSLDQLIRLAWLGSQVPEENIRKSVFDLHKDFIYSTVETSDGNQSVLILKPERMKLLREEMFGEEE